MENIDLDWTIKVWKLWIWSSTIFEKNYGAIQRNLFAAVIEASRGFCNDLENTVQRLVLIILLWLTIHRIPIITRKLSSPSPFALENVSIRIALVFSRSIVATHIANAVQSYLDKHKPVHWAMKVIKSTQKILNVSITESACHQLKTERV